MFFKRFAILALPVAALIIVSVFMSRPIAASAPDRVTVVIDAGHGGVDGGVTGVATGVKESELNLAFALELEKSFAAAGFNVVLTRRTSAGLYGALSSGFKLRDLKERVRVAKESGADVFVSVHMNRYSDGGRRGAQVFYDADSPEGKLLARSVQAALNLMPESARECEALVGDYYVLNEAPCPAVICECGFLSNAEDEKLLLDPAYREKLCQAIVSGTVGYLVENAPDAYRSTLAKSLDG